MNALRKIQNELDDQKATILKSSQLVTEQVTHNINLILDEKFKIWDEKHDNLKNKLENQEKRLYFLEKQARQRNIVFFGLEETETSYSSLENNLISFLTKFFSIKLDRRDIQEIKRIGKKGDSPRPIITTFLTLGIKIDIFSQRKLLKETPYYMKEDYPQYILEKRKELQKQVESERQRGNFAIIKYDKIIMKSNNKYTTSNNKRSLSNSPDSIPVQVSQVQEAQKSKTTKKAKTLTPLQRSSSISEGVLKPGLHNFFTTKNKTDSSTNLSNDNKNM